MDMDEVITKDGKTYRGMISWGGELRLKTENGKVMTFSKLDASSILFRK